MCGLVRLRRDCGLQLGPPRHTAGRDASASPAARDLRPPRAVAGPQGPAAPGRREGGPVRPGPGSCRLTVPPRFQAVGGAAEALINPLLNERPSVAVLPRAPYDDGRRVLGIWPRVLRRRQRGPPEPRPTLRPPGGGVKGGEKVYLGVGGILGRLGLYPLSAHSTPTWVGGDPAPRNNRGISAHQAVAGAAVTTPTIGAVRSFQARC